MKLADVEVEDLIRSLTVIRKSNIRLRAILMKVKQGYIYLKKYKHVEDRIKDAIIRETDVNAIDDAINTIVYILNEVSTV